MSMTRAVFSVVAVLLAVFTAIPAFACTQGDCPIGPCACFVENGDVEFSETSCELWQFSNGAARVEGGSDDYYGELASGTATIKQTIFGGGTGAEIDLFVDVEVIPDIEPGIERLYIEIRSTGGSLLETLDVIDGNESSGLREYQTSGFGGNDVVLQFRRATAGNDGDTEFQVDSVWFWRCGGS
jgi:hypothetical protein